MFPPDNPLEATPGASENESEALPTASSSASPSSATAALLGAGAAKIDGLVKDAVGVKLWVRLAQALLFFQFFFVLRGGGRTCFVSCPLGTACLPARRGWRGGDRLDPEVVLSNKCSFRR